MLPALRPCEPWPATLCCQGLPPDIDQTVLDRALAAATEVCWVGSGRRFGECEVTMRPCRSECHAGGSWPWWHTVASWSPATPWPAWWAWDVRCGCPQPCGCDRLCELELPRGPVSAVVAVHIDGSLLPSGAYRVDDYRTLVRTDITPGGDTDCWPICQDLSLPVGEPGTFAITWRYGRPVPQLGLLAVSTLACEIAKACLDLPCELPRRLSQVERQGLSVAFLDPQDFLKEGLTGLYFVDLFLRTFNPNRLQHRARVRRADDDRRRWRRTNT